MKEAQSNISTIDLLMDYDITKTDTCNTTLIFHKSWKDLDQASPDTCNSTLKNSSCDHKGFWLAKSVCQEVNYREQASKFFIAVWDKRFDCLILFARITQFEEKSSY